jgi:hypothetical protein
MDTNKIPDILPFLAIDEVQKALGPYSACAPVVMGLLENNLLGKKIIEVGPDIFGKSFLDYLVSKGADAVAIDRFDREYDTYGGISKGKYILLPMERVKEGFPKDSVDLIHIRHMHPSPYPQGVMRDLYFGNLFEKRRARRYIKQYGSLVADNFSSVLKSGGYALCWSVPTDSYQFNPNSFNKKDFDHRFWDLFTIIPGFWLDVYRKK